MILGIKNVIVGVLITAAAGYVYSNWKFNEGIELGKASQIALQAEVDSKVQEAKDELKLAVVEGLKGITVENKVIHNKAVREVQTKEIYKECIVPQEGKDIIKKALEPRL